MEAVGGVSLKFISRFFLIFTILLLSSRILLEVRTADDFYCKMETLMSELLNENSMDSNVLVKLISDLGPIRDLQKLRHKHLTASYNDQQQLK